jgi:uncharacterized membrane protein YtjA (UPF0391 family)
MQGSLPVKSGIAGRLWALSYSSVWEPPILTEIAVRDNVSHSSPDTPRGINMLYYAVVFFVIALIAALFGFGGIAAGAVGIAKILFFVFLVVAILSAVLGLARRT